MKMTTGPYERDHIQKRNGKEILRILRHEDLRDLPGTNLFVHSNGISFDHGIRLIEIWKMYDGRFYFHVHREDPYFHTTVTEEQIYIKTEEQLVQVLHGYFFGGRA